MLRCARAPPATVLSHRPSFCSRLRAPRRATVSMASAAPQYDIAVKGSEGVLGDCEWLAHVHAKLR